MLVIRDPQMRALSLSTQKSFEDRMVRHLTEFFPAFVARAGDAPHAFIGDGIAQAARFGITSEIDVARYIDLSVCLGPDFHTGERFPWVPPILQDTNLRPDQKVERIFDRTKRLQILDDPKTVSRRRV